MTVDSLQHRTMRFQPPVFMRHEIYSDTNNELIRYIILIVCRPHIAGDNVLSFSPLVFAIEILGQKWSPQSKMCWGAAVKN